MATLRYRVQLSWTGLGSPGVNVWHMREGGLGTAQNLGDALEAFYTTLAGSNLWPGGYTAHFDGVAVDEADSSVRQLDPWTAITGSSGNTHAPLISQCMLTIRTASATKSGLGRKFLGPLSAQAVQSDGSMLEATRAFVQTTADTLLAASEGEIEGAWGVYSRTQSLFRDMIAVQARDYIGALRSRRD